MAGVDVNCAGVVNYIHTYFFGSSPRGFSESILHYKIINQVHDNKNITDKRRQRSIKLIKLIK